MNGTQEIVIVEFEEPSLTGPASHRAFLAAARSCGFKLAGEYAVDDYLDPVSPCSDLAVFNEVLATSPDRIKRKFRTTWKDEKAAFINPATGKPEKISISEFRRRWEDLAWLRSNADHPIAYLFTICRELRTVATSLGAKKPRIRLIRGSREAFVPQDGDPEKTEELLGYFKHGWKTESAQ